MCHPVAAKTWSSGEDLLIRQVNSLYLILKLLSTVLMRGNSLMFTNKNIEFTDDRDGNSDYNEISVIE